MTPPFPMFDTPQAREESTMAAGGLNYSNMATNTPALLGFASSGHNEPTLMKKNYF